MTNFNVYIFGCSWHSITPPLYKSIAPSYQFAEYMQVCVYFGSNTPCPVIQWRKKKTGTPNSSTCLQSSKKSSKEKSFNSWKFKNSLIVMLKASAIRWRVLILGLNVLPFTKLSRVDWLTPLISDNLLIEMPLLLHSDKILLTRICAYWSVAAILKPPNHG